VTLDPQEQLDGGVLRDAQGRRQLVAVEKHAALAATDRPSAGTVTDVDGREQVVVLSGETGENLLSAESRVDVVREAPLNVKAEEYAAVGDGVTNDTAAVTAALAALVDNSELYFPPGTYLIDNATIPNKYNARIFSDGGATIKARNNGDSDYLLASYNYVNNVTATGASGVRLEGITLDANSIKAKALALQSWRSLIARCTLQGATSDNLVLACLTKNGSTVTGSLVEMRFERNILQTAGRYNFWVSGTIATDGFLESNILKNAVNSNIRMEGGAGGWLIEGNHAYNFGVSEVTGWDCDIQGAGQGLRVHGNYFESGPALQIRGIGAAVSVSVQGNEFSASATATGRKTAYVGSGGGSVHSVGNTYKGGGQMRSSGPGSGTKPFVIQSVGDTFFIANPVIYDATPAATFMVNGHVNDASWADGKVADGLQPTAATMRGVEYGTAAPSAGPHVVGDRCINTAPAAGGAPGWVCTTAGTPGTWKAMASLAA
jgi:hypothetical protein